MDPSPVVVLFEPLARRSRGHPLLDAGLRDYGFRVDVCPDLKALPQQIADGENVCVVLDGSLAQNCAAASRVRGQAPGARIVALVPSTTESALISVFHSGADAYCPASASVGLVAAAVSGVFRRTPPAVALSFGQWALTEKAWVLVGAGGVRIPLTTGERAFLATLFRGPQMRASHTELITAVSNAYGEPVTLQARTRLGVLVTRLRRKCQVAQESLPLRSVHGWGYMFVGPTANQGAAMQTPACAGETVVSGIG